MDRFRRMQIFIAVVEAGQLTRAAEDLHLSKSAVSHALTDLERYLDLQLIARSNRSWQLTDVGASYYAQCKKILADVEMMEDRARQDSRKLSGAIRLSAPNTFGSYTLAPVIAKFMDLHPHIIIEITLTERFVDLIEERVDLAFWTGDVKDTSLIGQTIGAAEMMVCASTSYLNKYGTPETHLDLKKHKCIRYSRSPAWRLYNNNKWYEFTPKDHLITDNGENMREFCIRGQGIAFMPTSLAEFALRRGRLVKLLPSYEFKKMPVQVLRLSNKMAPNRVLQFLAFAVAELSSRKRDISEFV